jgi:hypothetical protein
VLAGLRRGDGAVDSSRGGDAVDIVEWLIERKLARAVVGLVLVGISALVWLGGHFWPWGWAVGGILLLTAIPGGGPRR